MAAHRIDTALVIGAGPVGLFTALSLRRHGGTVRIADRGVRQNQESYAVAINPMSLSLLEGCGLLDEALALGLRVSRLGLEGFGGVDWILDLKESSARFPFMLLLPQSKLEGILIAALRKVGVEVEWNRELEGLEFGRSAVTAKLNHLGEGSLGYAVSTTARLRVGESRVKAHFVVGADGRHSTVRRELGIGWVTTGPGRAYEVFEFAVADSRDMSARVVSNANGVHALWPLPGNHFRMSFEVPGDWEEELTIGELGVQLERNGIVANVPKQLFWSSRVEFLPGHASAMGAGQCWLAGDSAHQTLPHGAQSMNGGLTEGALLAARIGEAVDSAPAGSGFADYSEGRLAEWKSLLGEGLSGEERDMRGVLPATGRLHAELLATWQERMAAAR